MFVLQEAKKIKRNGKVAGARLVFSDPDNLDGKGNPATEVKEYGIGNMSTVAFKKMLMGTGGSVSSPKGEAKAWLSHFNAVNDVSEDL